jgi:hypothetical protein
MGFAPLLFVISDCTDVSGSVLGWEALHAKSP